MEDILRQLLSTDNTQRGEAETKFNATKQQPSACISSLCALATSSHDETIRATSCVLLRRTATELWNGVSPEVQSAVQSSLLACLRAEPRPNLRHKLCDTIAVIAGGLVAEGKWPELFPALFEMSKVPSTAMAADGSTIKNHERESALYLFSQLAEYLGPALEPHIITLHSTCMMGLNDPDLDVQIAALQATCSILNTLDGKKCVIFEEAVPLMLRPISEALNKGEEEAARNAIELFIEVIEAEPKFWKKHLATAVQAMLTVASTASLDDDTRQMGLEFVISAAEKLPSACRKIPHFVENVAPIAMSMMLSIEDEPEWYTRDDDLDDTDEYTNFDAGQESLDRLAIALGGKAVLPVVFGLISNFINNQESWVHRHAAILALSQIGEGCMKQIESQLTSVVSMVIQKFGDPHPRVRWAAINCIGQMCTDFGPRIQKENSDLILPALIAVMGDTSCARVQAHGAAAVINFCDEATPALMTPYLDSILSRLMGLLQSPSKMIQEQAVTALAAVSDAAGTQFLPYYDSFMPLLKKVLAVTVGRKELRKLRGKVMECISLVGLSVGKEKFFPDAASVMDTLVRTQGQRMDPDDPQAFYLMQAYARICRCLKEQFIPYLPYVMPGLLDAASQKPEIEVLDALDEDEDEDPEDMETIRIGDKRIGIRTSALEDKATAVSMIACFVNELQGGFIQFAEQTVQLMVPLLKFFYHDECRTSAAQCLPDLVKCVKMQGNQEQVKQVVSYMLPALLDAMKGEPDVEVLVSMTGSLSEIIDLAGPGVLDLDMLTKLVDTLLTVCADRDSRILERNRQAQEEGWDEEELEDAEFDREKDDELLDHIADVISTSLRHYRFISLFEKSDNQGRSLLQVAATYLSPDRPASERRVALCIFDDVIEYGEATGAMYLDRVLPAMLMYCTDDDPDVRQAAAYGIGISAEKCGGLFLQAGGGNALGPIEAVISAQDARSEDNQMATDNTISALSKIIEFQPSCLPGDLLIQAKKSFINYLPMVGDNTEARTAHGRLVRWLEKGDPQLLSMLPQVMRVFAKVWGDSELMNDDDTKRSIDWVRAHVPAETLAAAISGLSEVERGKLQSFGL